MMSGIIIPLCSMAAQRIIPEKSSYDFKYNYVIAIVITGISLSLMLICLVFIILYQFESI